MTNTEKKLIGSGGQYQVYDAGNRLHKVPNTSEEAIIAHRQWASTPKEAEVGAAQGLYLRDLNVPRVLRMALRYSELGALLGGPEARPDGSFLQTKVEPLSVLIERCSPADVIQGLERFAECVKGCWKYALYDYMWHFDSNYGLAGAGNVVFFDFGEVSSYTPFAQEQVESNWRERFEFFQKLDLVPAEIRSPFVGLMENTCSLRMLEEVWGTGLDAVDRQLLVPAPLSDRVHDIPQLVRDLCRRHCAEQDRRPCRFTGEAEERLMAYQWGDPATIEPFVVASIDRSEGEVRPEDVALPDPWPY